MQSDSAAAVQQTEPSWLHDQADALAALAEDATDTFTAVGGTLVRVVMLMAVAWWWLGGVALGVGRLWVGWSGLVGWRGKGSSFPSRPVGTGGLPGAGCAGVACGQVCRALTWPCCALLMVWYPAVPLLQAGLEVSGNYPIVDQCQLALKANHYGPVARQLVSAASGQAGGRAGAMRAGGGAACQLTGPRAGFKISRTPKVRWEGAVALWGQS